MDDTRYVVRNENTLGCIFARQPGWLDVLQGDPFTGGADWKNGPVALLEGVDAVRPATLADFARFRVMPPPGFGLTPLPA